MSTTYTWRPSNGKYFSSSGTSADAANHFYYSSNRAFRMDFNAPTIDKKTISIKSAILRVVISTANSATLTIGYNYSTSWDNRKSLLAKITGVSMGTSTGAKTIDITSIVQAYCRESSTCGAMARVAVRATPTSGGTVPVPAILPSARISRWSMIPAKRGYTRTAHGRRRCLMSTTTASGNRRRFRCATTVPGGDLR